MFTTVERIGETRAPFFEGFAKDFKYATKKIVSFAVVGGSLELLSRIFTEADKARLGLPPRFAILAAPFSEELLFRFTGHGAISLVQEEDQADSHWLNKRSVKRIVIMGTLFSLAHALNPHKKLSHKLVQCTITLVDGLVWGALYEKYQTTSVTFAAHGLHNFFACLTLKDQKMGLLLMVINDTFFLFLAATEVIDNALHSLKGKVVIWIKDFKASLPMRNSEHNLLI